MNEPIKIKAQRALWIDKIEFLLIKDHAHAKPIEFEPTTPEMMCRVIEPSFSLEQEEAQALMDQLWYCGLRPTEGTGSAGSLKATENHLDDMRKIVFKYIELDDK